MSKKKNIKRLYRNDRERVIGGVCSGVADYFNTDPVLIRVIAVLLFFMSGFGLLAYIILWIIIPLKPIKPKRKAKKKK